MDCPEKGPIGKGVSNREPTHVLVAEDDGEMRSLLVWALRREGYEVTECRDGIELLDHVGRILLSIESTTVRLIIADIRMPGATGLQALERLQHGDGTPPVILVTAFGDAETHLQAQRLGAVAMFDKPFDLQALMESVREVLSVDTRLRGNAERT